MAAVGALWVVLVAGFGLVASLVLYALVRAEGGGETMDREEAERVARRDTDDTRR